VKLLKGLIYVGVITRVPARSDACVSQCDCVARSTMGWEKGGLLGVRTGKYPLERTDGDGDTHAWI